MSLAHTLPSRPFARTVLSSICSQLFPAKLFAFQSAPFCPRAERRLFAPLNAARFRDAAEFCDETSRRAKETSVKMREKEEEVEEE